ncbi:MAG: phenylalanine--tRNA ligase subunit alpha [archaeon]
MTDVAELAKALHPLELKVLPVLSHSTAFSDIVEKSRLKDVEVMRALQWLQSKGALEIKEDVREVLVLGENGKKALTHGLPERIFLKSISHSAKNLDTLRKDSGLNPEELNVCIGLLKSRGLINIAAGMNISITDLGKKSLEKDSFEELLLKKIEKEEIDITSLQDTDKFAFDALKKRKDVIRPILKKEWHVIITALGKELIKAVLAKPQYSLSSDSHITKTENRLTPEMLKTGSWKKKEFRAYDLSFDVPKIQRGKRHFVNQAISSAKRIWLDLGFREMTGSMVQTSFWNFDALFTAQDHPVRDMQDTFFIKDPKTGTLPEKKLVEKVRKAHESGGDTGSAGWQYDWSEDEAKKNVLRTHTTALSARTVASLKKEDLPVKYFALGKCFRNETLDWAHLFEFNQTEGIVVDENANFRHLLGYLKAFFRKMGYEKARFRPAYFPYTEFSVEIDVYHPVHQKWFELGGAGIFRPEVVKPMLGIDVPVLAWGPGFDRIIIEYFKITDIRDLYKNDLKQLREMKEWMR